MQVWPPCSYLTPIGPHVWYLRAAQIDAVLVVIDREMNNDFTPETTAKTSARLADSDSADDA